MIVAAMQHETLGSINHVKWLAPSVYFDNYIFKSAIAFPCIQWVKNMAPMSIKSLDYKTPGIALDT